MIPTLRALASTAGSLIHTRLALAGVELEEEVQRLIGAAALALVALLLVSLALVVGTFTIVVAVAPEYRVATMAGITAVYLLGAVFLVLRVKGIFTNRPPIFAATLAELDKDKETLKQMARAHDAADEAHERALRENEDAFAPTRPPVARTEGAL
ncbi:MAG: phage holin family protein [Burkholderiaceae bacterium]